MNNETISDKEQGRIDCESGIPAKFGMPDAYYEEYSNQYAKEQQQSAGESN